MDSLRFPPATFFGSFKGLFRIMSSEGHGMALAKRWKVLQLVVYTMSTMVFGMICSALGPSIPWLASNADVEPETLGWLPAAQAVMCIVSGLASSLMTFVPRRFHHCLLCLALPTT